MERQETIPFSESSLPHELFFYHSSHGEINTVDPLVDPSRNPPVYDLQGMNTKNLTIHVKIRNRASMMHTIRSSRFTKTGDVQYLDDTQFDDYVFIEIQGNEIERITISNPPKTLIVYEKYTNTLIKTPNIEFTYYDSEETKEFQMASAIELTQDQGKFISLPENPWTNPECALFVPPKTGLERIHGLGKDSLLLNILTNQVLTKPNILPNDTVNIILYNSTCLNSPNVFEIYREFHFWSKFFGMLLPQGAFHTADELERDTQNLEARIFQIKKEYAVNEKKLQELEDIPEDELDDETFERQKKDIIKKRMELQKKFAPLLQEVEENERDAKLSRKQGEQVLQDMKQTLSKNRYNPYPTRGGKDESIDKLLKKIII